MKKSARYFYGICIITLIMFSTITEGGLIVNPANPTADDSVSIDFSTWLSNPGVVVMGTDQTINGYDIYLDLFTYQQPGIWPQVVVPYDHIFSIGSLPVGIYQVQASLYEQPSPFPYPLGSTSFEVIPEPASLSLIGLVTGGIYFARRFFIA